MSVPFGLLITTRLGFRFPHRALASQADLDARILVLRRTSMRSIAGLCESGVLWVLQTDPSHVAFLRSRIAAGAIAVPPPARIAVVAREGMQFSAADLALLSLPAERFLCLRLDSDDYYYPDVLRRALPRVAALRRGTMVEFPRGYLLDISTDRVAHHNYLGEAGPFYGIVTDTAEPLAAIGDHSVASVGRTRLSVTPRAWIQTVHGGNDSTSFLELPWMRRARDLRRKLWRAVGARPWGDLALGPLDLLRVSPAAARHAQLAVRQPAGDPDQGLTCH